MRVEHFSMNTPLLHDPEGIQASSRWSSAAKTTGIRSHGCLPTPKAVVASRCCDRLWGQKDHLHTDRGCASRPTANCFNRFAVISGVQREVSKFASSFFALSLGLLLAGLTPVANAQDFHALQYNHPGLNVDLGVGLWAWPVPADADGDGDYDLVVSCPDKPSNGLWFFENISGDTRDNPLPQFLPAKRIGSAVHYVLPSYTADGLRVLTPGVEHPKFFESGLDPRVKIPVDAKFYQPIGDQKKGPKVRHNEWRYCDYDGDEAVDLIVAIEDWSDYGWDDAWNEKGEWKNGRLHGFIFLFHNEGTTAKPKYAEPVKLTAAGKPIDVYGCPTPNFEDFDNDGDLDLICGEFVDGFTYFKNVGSRTAPEYAAGVPLTTPAGSRLAMDLEMIVPIAFDWNRDGDIDLIVGDEDGRVAFLEHAGDFDSNMVPRFHAPRYFQQVADTLKCGALATPVGFDWDGDGDTDLLSGNTAGYIEYFENLSGPGVEFPKWQAPVRMTAGGETFRVMAGANGSIQGPAEAKWGYTSIGVADWDGDNLPDILVNGIWGRVAWLKNVGTREKPELAAAQWVEVQWPAETPKPDWTWWNPEGNQLVTQWRTTPIPIDWDDDGLMDLVMLDHQGYLSLYRREKRGEKLVLLPPERIFDGDNFSASDSKQQITNKAPGVLQLNSQSAGASGRRKLCIVDWDGDGRRDLLVNSTSANLLLQTENDGSRISFTDQGPLAKQSIQGHTTSPTVVDFNADGIPDFIGGAEDGRFYYMRNPRSK